MRYQPRTLATLSDGWLESRAAELSMLDLEAFTMYTRMRKRMLAESTEQTLTPRDRAKLNMVLTHALQTQNQEPSQAEMMYAELRVLYRQDHRTAVRAAAAVGDLRGSTSEEVLMFRRTVRTAMQIARDKLASSVGVTKQDVVQGLLNAVAVAASSKDLVEAWRELGRLLGYYEETKIRIEQTVKQDINVNHTLQGVDLRMLSDSDLLRHLNPEMAKQLAAPAPRLLEQPVGEIEDAVLIPVDRPAEGAQ